MLKQARRCQVLHDNLQVFVGDEQGDRKISIEERTRRLEHSWHTKQALWKHLRGGDEEDASLARAIKRGYGPVTDTKFIPTYAMAIKRLNARYEK